MATPDAPDDRPSGAPAAPGDGLPPVAPDIVEQELGEAIDNIVPTIGYQMLPLVGIGGSAGAIRALQAFFEAMPPESGLAFAVVLHLSPNHASVMADMIGKWTRMPVVQASDGEEVRANHVYVIPPAKQMTAVNGHLRLADLGHHQGRRVAVDLFFRSLADTHGPHAAAIVLSGADGDGVLGVRRIKERGGLTIAQDPDEAEHPGMPRASIESGMVDWVLKAAEMPQRILDYVAREARLNLPPEDGHSPAVLRPESHDVEGAFRDILAFMRTRTRRDFSYYKRATILRRISRRMQVHGVDSMDAYLVVLRTQPPEASALLKDLLISVTNFFRDRDAFAALEARIPSLFEGKGPGDTIRVWCPACATGEEAYSLAMLLLEHARTIDQPPAIQVFGCDLDDDAVQSARSGVFAAAIVADVPEERLRRYFVRDYRGYRVQRPLREAVLFAAHDLLKDAPFSRLDLVSCRNLLIYLNRDAQDRALDTFHFALKPDGLLFLGSSESVDDASPLFRAVDKKYRIYMRRSFARPVFSVPIAPPLAAPAQDPDAMQKLADAARHAGTPLREATAPPPIARRGDDAAAWGQLHLRLIERFAPPSILVDRDYEIRHLSLSAGRFLEVAGGPPSTNLLRLVHPGLRSELRALLYRAATSGEPAEVLDLPAEIEGKRQRVTMRVFPMPDTPPGYLIATFEARDPDAAAVAPTTFDHTRASDAQHDLERELDHLKAHLRDTVEQYEASTEELKASNEELQSMNEELRSATEELETSREELQSINEELTTVNHELKNSVDDLGRANSALANLMSATAIVTLFLDRDLRVMRYTDAAAPIFNLMPGDIGRPLAHLQHLIEYPELAQDATRVLEKLIPVTRQVQGAGGARYESRLLPYRTTDDRIAGVVLTLFDVTERERVKAELAENLACAERLRSVGEHHESVAGMRTLYDAIVDTARFIVHADGATVEVVGGAEGDLRTMASQGLPDDLVERVRELEVRSDAALRRGVRAFVDFSASATRNDADRSFHAAGFRCAQSTRLAASDGRAVGLIKTFWRALYHPTERELRYLDLLARLATDAIGRQLAGDAMRDRVTALTRSSEGAGARESRMLALEREVNELAARLGEAPRYPLDVERPAD
jgi:two-component system CheB/CheR fusion protein